MPCHPASIATAAFAAFALSLHHLQGMKAQRRTLESCGRDDLLLESHASGGVTGTLLGAMPQTEVENRPHPAVPLIIRDVQCQAAMCKSYIPSYKQAEMLTEPASYMGQKGKRCLPETKHTCSHQLVYENTKTNELVKTCQIFLEAFLVIIILKHARVTGTSLFHQINMVHPNIPKQIDIM